MRRLILVCFLLVGCSGPTPEQIQATVDASVAATAAAVPTATVIPTPDPCGTEALTAYADQVEPLVAKFERQAALVGNTPRVSMGVPLQELLNIQEEAIALKAPVCIAHVHADVSSMMGLYRLAYENFAGQGDESMTTAGLMLGGEILARVKVGLAGLRTGAIPPTPTPVPA